MTGAVLSGVLPLSIAGGQGGDDVARAEILLRSLDAFLEPGDAAAGGFALAVFCPAAERVAIAAALGAPRRFPIRVMDEELALPGVGQAPAPGWRRQQAIKLAATALAPSAFVLLLDADVVLCRALRIGDLVAEGRCLSSWDEKATHAAWWSASAALLGLPVHEAREGLGVTPQILAREVAAALRVHLRRGHGVGAGFLGLLSDEREWTEYTLYSVFAEAMGLLERHHRPHDPQARQMIGRSVWFAEQAERYSLADIHRDPRGAWFSVCQSRAQVPVARIEALYRDLLEAAGA